MAATDRMGIYNSADKVLFGPPRTQIPFFILTLTYGRWKREEQARVCRRAQVLDREAPAACSERERERETIDSTE